MLYEVITCIMPAGQPGLPRIRSTIPSASRITSYNVCYTKLLRLCAGKVFLCGTRDSRLEMGKQMGADRLINVKNEDAVQVVRDETDGIGADLVIESSGSDQGIQTAIEMSKRMGKILLVGYPEKPASANFSMMGSRNIHIYSIRGEGWANCSRAVSLLAQGRISLKPLATHTFPLDQIDRLKRNNFV